MKIKFVFYRMNSFGTFEQPYFCCKTKLKISLFYKQNEFFYKVKFFLTELNFMKGDTNIYFKKITLFENFFLLRKIKFF